MTILHVTDFHFNKSWFDWLLHRAPPHDLTVMSGDLLDLASPTPHRQQIAWVSDWLGRYPRPLAIASGNHDLEWHDQTERWMPAYWLRYVANPNVWVDGQRVEMNGTSILNIGCATRPKGGEADIWVVHAGPTKTLVTTRSTGGDAGDPDLNASVIRYAPRLVLSGHVHDPVHWRQHEGSTLFLNPGYAPQAEIPNHILVRTEDLNCRLFRAPREESHEAENPGTAPRGAEAATAVA
jgi:Icc-related predicted phosphoesterase